MMLSGHLCVRFVFAVTFLIPFFACSNKKLAPVVVDDINKGGPAFVPPPPEGPVNPCAVALKVSIELMLPPTTTVRVGAPVSYGIRATGCKGRYQLQREAEVAVNFTDFTYFTKIYNAPGSVSETITVVALDEAGSPVEKVSVSSASLAIAPNSVPFFGCDVIGSPLTKDVLVDPATGVPAIWPTFSFTILTTRNTQVMGVFAFPGAAAFSAAPSPSPVSNLSHSRSVQVQGLGRQRVSFNLIDTDNSTPIDQMVQECSAEVILVRVDPVATPTPSPVVSVTPTPSPTMVPPMAAATFNGLSPSAFTITMLPNTALNMLWVASSIPSSHGVTCGVQHKEVDASHAIDLTPYTVLIQRTSPYPISAGTFQPGKHYKIKLVCYDNTDTAELYPVQVGQYIYVNNCIGKIVSGSTACWYLGSSGQSCSTVCSSHGGYHRDTQTFSGSAGTDGQCGAVMNRLGVSPSTIIDASAYAVGCTRVNGSSVVYRWKGDPTNEGSSLSSYQRACGCNL